MIAASWPAPAARRRPFDGDAALRHASRARRAGPASLGLAARARRRRVRRVASSATAGLAEVRLQAFESHGHPRRQRDRRPARRRARVRGGGRAPRHRARRARRLRRRRRRGRADRGRARPGRAAAPAAHARVRLLGRRGGVVHGAGAPTAGSRAYVRVARAPRRATWWRRFAIEMCGWSGRHAGRCTRSPTPTRCGPGGYVDRARAGWCARRSTARARAGAALGVGDPCLSWLYQPAVRTFRVGLYGDDLSFLQAGAARASSPPTRRSRAFYPWYHQAERHRRTSSTRRRWRAWARRCWGRSTRSRACPRGPAREPDWFAAFGYVVGAVPLVGLGALSLVPGLGRGQERAGLLPAAGPRRPVRLPAVEESRARAVGLPGGQSRDRARRGGRGRRRSALLPLALLLVLGAAAWRRGFVTGLWASPWEVGAAAAGMALLFVGASRATPHRAPRAGRPAPRPRRRGMLR